MALTATTLSSAQALNDKTAVVASATGFAAGNFILIDGEVQQVTKEYVSGTTVNVIRGLEGTQQLAHPASAKVITGLGTDFPLPGPGGPFIGYPTQRARVVRSYSAAGAITLPTAGQDMVAIINGTGALAMTLADPTKEMDGCFIYFVPNGKAAHTVTYTAGFGANTTNSDVLTFHATQVTSAFAVAANGVWNLVGFVAGAATVAGPGLG